MVRSSKARSRMRAGVGSRKQSEGYESFDSISTERHDILAMERHLKITSLMNELVQLVEDEVLISSADKFLLKELQTRMQFSIAARVAPTDPPVPEVAPAKWLERKNRDETPLDFIRREYAPWLGKGLSKRDIRRLDRSLYLAFYAWKAEGGVIPPDFDLPTQKQVNDAELERRGFASGQLDLGVREAMRLYHVMKRRPRGPRRG
jgi:hypothetical protein